MESKKFKDGIVLDIIGDSGPFSTVGKSIGYRIRVNGEHYLIDCGAPVFSLLGEEGLKKTKGIFATHSHEDHRRWFTDIALFKFYNPRITNKLHLITEEIIHEEFHKNSRGALERSLSADSRRVVELPYNLFVDSTQIGPSRNYRIVQHTRKDNSRMWVVVDNRDREISHKKAKIVINPLANRPRLLFKDPVNGLWIEPETFYSYKNNVFYSKDKHPFVDKKAGLEIQALKSITWHGPPTISMRIKTALQELIATSDTMYNPAIWEEIATQRHKQNIKMSRKQFDTSSILYGNINDMIEQVWGIDRYEEAINIYEENVLFLHDVASKNSVVHTDYDQIEKLGKKALLTHSPDEFTSELLIVRPSKSYLLKDNIVYDIVHGKSRENYADIYIKKFTETFVGFRNPRGAFTAYRKKNGDLGYCKTGSRYAGKRIMRFDMYQDIKGEYYPVISNGTIVKYITGPKGNVIRTTFGNRVSSKRVNDIRARVEMKYTRSKKTNKGSS